MRPSDLHPIVRRVRVEQLRLARRVADARARPRFARTLTTERPPVILVRHGSLLRRRLGDTEPSLQESKIANLLIAVPTLDGLLILPGETFSFWERVGPPSARRGYGTASSSPQARSGRAPGADSASCRTSSTGWPFIPRSS